MSRPQPLTPDDLAAAIRALPGRTPAAPVPEAELSALEAALGVTLPEGYRNFLARVADGIDVPGLPQLFTVARVQRTLAQAGMRPAEPFPYTPEVVAVMMDVLSRHRLPEAGAALRPWLHFGALDGCVPIADGDGDEVVLVVTGPCRGQLFRTGDLDLPEHPRLHSSGTGAKRRCLMSAET